MSREKDMIDKRYNRKKRLQWSGIFKQNMYSQVIESSTCVNDTVKAVDSAYGKL